MRFFLSTPTHARRHITCAMAIFAVSVALGCAEKQVVPVVPKASPQGLGVMVSEPTVRLAAGTTCGETATTGAADRFKSAATGALTKAGFSVVTTEAEQAFAAALDLEIDYCSDAGIVSGTTSLELKRKTGASVWRGQAVGDQARGETAASTMAELVDAMLYDPRVIKATEDARR